MIEKNSFLYILPGVPIPLKRHRHTGKFTYDPQTKEKAKAVASLIFPKNAPKMATECIKVEIEYQMPIPKNFSLKAKVKLLNTFHTKRPDLSNLIKFTEDAFNGVLWKDDSLISSLTAKKVYSFEPQTRIFIHGL